MKAPIMATVNPNTIIGLLLRLKKYLSIKAEALASFLDRLDPSRSIFLERDVNLFTTNLTI